MVKAITQLNCNVPVSMGDVAQVELLPAMFGLAESIDASDTIVSNIVCSGGYKAFAFSAKGTETGTISIQRYLDQAGTIPQGAALTGSMTAATDTVVNCVDGKPFQSLKVSIENTGGDVSTLTNMILLLQAN